MRVITPKTNRIMISSVKAAPFKRTGQDQIADRLNFCVRNENRCFPIAVAANQ